MQSRRQELIDYIAMATLTATPCIATVPNRTQQSNNNGIELIVVGLLFWYIFTDGNHEYCHDIPEPNSDTLQSTWDGIPTMMNGSEWSTCLIKQTNQISTIATT